MVEQGDASDLTGQGVRIRAVLPGRETRKARTLAGFIADHKRPSKPGAAPAREEERALKAARSGRPVAVAD